VRKIAIPMPIGTARIMARVEVTKVPTIEGRPPNSLEVGSQALEVRKEKPNAFAAGIEPITREPMTPAKIRRTAAAAAQVRKWKRASPRPARAVVSALAARSEVAVVSVKATSAINCEA